MAKKSTVKSNWPKYLLQWGVLALLVFFLSGLASLIFTKMAAPDPEKYCPFGGLEAFGTYLANNSLPCSMTSMQIVMGIVLAAVVVLLGKLFCGYLCPVGTVEDLLKKLRQAVGFKAFNINSNSVLDKALRIIKYILLFVAFYMTMTASELFCKNFDPYYATATGFKGEITLWMSIVTVAIVLILGLFVDRFWCKYICPLGAVSNSLKFWVWLVVLVALWWVLGLLGIHIAWIWLLGAMCLVGYLLEILCGKPKTQLIGVVIDNNKCTGACRLCQKNCPYNIDVPTFEGKVNSVDCTLCGECVASCPVKALSIGVKPGVESKCSKFIKLLPATLTVVSVIIAFLLGGKFEVPTIDENWGIEPGMKLETLKVEGLKSVKCFSSSKAFKAKMEKVPGVHGVKTFVGSHTVVVTYDANATDAEKIEAQMFVPSKFRVNSLEPNAYDSLKCVTIRTEKMFDKLDLNYLGMQMRLTEKKIFGLESMYDCPLIVKVYMAPDEELNEAWFKNIVEKKTLEMPVHGGGVKMIDLGFKFIRMEKGCSFVSTQDYLRMMFDSFAAEYRKNVDADAPQWWYEIVDHNYEKPIVRRGMPFLSNHLSSHDGVLGTYLTLNEDLEPCIRIRYTAPMTDDELFRLMTMPKWTIKYSDDDIREVDAKMSFETPGHSILVN
mgnify:FL=1